MLATNTSSIPVTSSPGRFSKNVVGMHFFNPPPLMELLEVIAPTRPATSAGRGEQAGEAMGKRVILGRRARVLVNRCGRPFAGEALRLLAERVATPRRSTASAA